MTNYLASFSIYTMAMVGIIFFALFVFKTFSNKCFSKKSAMLNVEDSMGLSPRKTLYIINADNQRFLIAADVERTTLISQLDSKSKAEIKPVREDKSLDLNCLDGVESIGEFASVVDFKKGPSNKGPMMRELAKKVKAI